MSSELIINASLPETRIALMEDGEIQELLIERASGKGIVGNIYKGRVTRVLPGMQAAFVDIGLEKAAFLYVDDVYVHSEIWEEEEGTQASSALLSEIQEPGLGALSVGGATGLADPKEGDSPEVSPLQGAVGGRAEGEAQPKVKIIPRNRIIEEAEKESHQNVSPDVAPDVMEEQDWSSDALPGSLPDSLDDDLDSDLGDDDSGEPAKMGPNPHGPSDDSSDGFSSDSDQSQDQPQGTIAPESSQQTKDKGSSGESEAEESESPESEEEGSNAGSNRRRHRRGRRGGRFRKRGPNSEVQAQNPSESQNPSTSQERYPENYHEQVADSGNLDSDRSSMRDDPGAGSEKTEVPPAEGGRPEVVVAEGTADRRPVVSSADRPENRSEFRAHRSRDRRIRAKVSSRPTRNQVNIQDLLKEGQEVLVQVAKDPIATKGARLTCHISLPGRHLVCMPTIDHVGVSRRIDREDERRRLREYVERNRPRNLGFIVRTASGKQQSEKRIKQDIDYLTRLWNEIKEKASDMTAPALVYEDLNAVLRAIRDWVTEEIDKVIVDSRYHYNEILRFVSHFMPPLKQKVELYHGDIPVFDAYGISTELSRALERKVWLKSGGYIVVDQAEALVAIDVNTGRYVGKKNLEDTILKTNLEAVQEIAYQLRLRNCGGIIILDLIDMEKEENKQRVYRALEEALSRDRARPTILKISELGLVEMTRKRTRDTIVRTLCESCTYCEGKGFIKSKQTVAYEVLREIEREGIERDVGKILVQAHPDVIDILAIDERETLDQLERRYRKSIYLQAVNDFHPEQFEVAVDKRERPDRSRDHDRSHEPHSEKDRSGHAGGGHDRGGRHRHRTDSPSVIVPVSSAQKEAQPLPGGEGKKRLDAEAATGGRQKNSSHGPNSSSVSNGELTPGNTDPSSSQPKGGVNDGFYDEEDRLAFLRAQAAQDAALARLGSGGGHSSAARVPGEPSATHSRGGMGGGAGGRRNPRGRRGGKFRRGNDRNRGPNQRPKPFGYNQGSKWNDSPREAVAAEADTSSSGSGNESPSGGGDGGGSDHSQPPV